MAKIPLETWARDSFQWAIDNGFYTEKTKLNEVREEYDIQQMVVMMHRISKASSSGSDGVPRDEFEAHRHAEGVTGPPR